MGRYILDTHALVFSLSSPRKLGRAARSALRRVESGKDEALIPAAVVAEVCLLRELGRTLITLPALKALFEGAPQISLLPLDLAQLDFFSALTSIRDPFDRLVVSAALARSAKLITKDNSLADSGLVDVVWD